MLASMWLGVLAAFVAYGTLLAGAPWQLYLISGFIGLTALLSAGRDRRRR